MRPFAHAAAAFYLTMAVATFGHSAANSTSCSGFGRPECIVYGGMMAGLFWPFYWSWECFALLASQEDAR